MSKIKLQFLSSLLISCVVTQAVSAATPTTEPTTATPNGAAATAPAQDTTSPTPDTNVPPAASTTPAAADTPVGDADTQVKSTEKATQPAPAPKKPVILIDQLPNFKTTNSAHLSTKIEAGITKFNTTIAESLKKEISWDTTVQPVIEQLAIIKANWNLLIILNNVDQNGATRNALSTLAPKMAALQVKLLHNMEFYNALKTIKNSPDFAKLKSTQQVFIQQTLLDYKLAGADLNEIQQQRYASITKRLRELGKTFSENLTNSTESWEYFIAQDEARRVEGLPEIILKQAASKAAEQNKNGWVLTLDINNLVAVETFAKDRKLRETVYNGFATLASKQDADLTRRKWDNTPIISETLDLRQELAVLLGYPNFAAYAVSDRLPPDPAQALQFLSDLATKLKPAAQAEFRQLEEFAKLDKQKMRPWDVSFYAQWQKAQLAGDSQVKSREYFQIDQVLQGLFNLASILFNVDFVPMPDASTWNENVMLFNVTDVHNKTIGYFYLDLYTRPDKAPQDKTLMYTSRLHADQEVVPVAVLSTNLRKDGTPLIMHDEVIRIFAQFGDMLQRILSEMDYPLVASTNGSTWDAISHSSQFMQNWAWQKEYIKDTARHYKNGAPISDELFATLLATSRYDRAINLLQQLQLAIFDLRIHMHLPEDKNKSALHIYNEITEEFEVLPITGTDMLPNRFTESFTTNIAGTYFCYYLDQAVAADSFADFMENGIFSAKVGHKFRDIMLEQGGQASLLELFKKFRDRPVESKYLLQLLGIKN